MVRSGSGVGRVSRRRRALPSGALLAGGRGFEDVGSRWCDVR